MDLEVLDPMIIEINSFSKQNESNTKPKEPNQKSVTTHQNIFAQNALSFKNVLIKDQQQILMDMQQINMDPSSQHSDIQQTNMNSSQNDSISSPPIRKGEFMTVTINKQQHEKRIKFFETALIGRLVLSPGDKPWSLDDLKFQLQQTWKPKEDWLISSMGRGFYTFRFSSMEERDRIWANPIPSLKPGTLRLQPWTAFFNPYKLKSTNAQVWVRFYELGAEYYYQSFLWNLARCIGTPLKIDQRSLDGSLTHFARILIEIDLSKPLENQIMIDHGEGLCTFTSVGYERMPDFCKLCNLVGHSMANCRNIKAENSNHKQQPSHQQNEDPIGKNNDEENTKDGHLDFKKAHSLNQDPTWSKVNNSYGKNKQKWGDMDDDVNDNMEKELIFQLSIDKAEENKRKSEFEIKKQSDNSKEHPEEPQNMEKAKKFQLHIDKTEAIHKPREGENSKEAIQNDSTFTRQSCQDQDSSGIKIYSAASSMNSSKICEIKGSLQIDDEGTTRNKEDNNQTYFNQEEMMVNSETIDHNSKIYPNQEDRNEEVSQTPKIIEQNSETKRFSGITRRTRKKR